MPVSFPARLRSYRNESNVADDQRNVSRFRGTKRSMFSPQVSTLRAKLKVREGMTISADDTSVVLAVRASQIPSQSRDALSGFDTSPSVRAPAALMRKK